VSWLATKMMQRQMERIDIPPIPEFIELVADSGAQLYACKATVDMFGLTMEDFVPQVEERGRVLRQGRRRPNHLHVAAACPHGRARAA
jgi:peroxiredoxin family protein